MKKINTLLQILILAFVFGIGSIKAQCLTDHYLNEELKNNPKLQSEVAGFQKKAKPFYGASGSQRAATRIIPVVVHVIHQYGPENISKNQILDQIRLLNLDYRRLNADTSNTNPIFKGVAADFNIEFRLATKDPLGNCTDGIERIYSPLTNNANNNSKLNPWPKNSYLNIWIVKTIDSKVTNGNGIVLGYAQFPFSGMPRTDGVIIRGDYFGSIGTAAGNGNNGRVATHEIGHWLGLFHTFQGGCAGAAGTSEEIEDTPPVESANSGCSSYRNSCKTDSPDLQDQTENYMDYTDGKCQNMFTKGQLAVADYTFKQYRGSMITKANLIFTGVYDSAAVSTCMPKTDFHTQTTIVCQGRQVNFKDFSYRANVSSYKWYFDGGTPATATTVNPNTVYNQPGKYSVTLVTTNQYGSDSLVRGGYITVLPSVAGMKTPTVYNFENTNTIPQYIDTNSMGGNGWELNTHNGYNSNGCMYIRNYYNITHDDEFELVLDPVDMTAAHVTNLEFNVSYALTSSNSTDNLKVFVSTDCGNNWNNVYNKSGSTLASSAEQATLFTPQDASQWRKDKINLATYKNTSSLIVKFVFTTSGWGNNIYIDNINIGDWPLAANIVEENSNINIYPNPSSGAIVIENITPNSNVKIYNTQGKVVWQQTTQQSLQPIDLSNASKGLYFIQITNKEGNTITKKVTIE